MTVSAASRWRGPPCGSFRPCTATPLYAAPRISPLHSLCTNSRQGRIKTPPHLTPTNLGILYLTIGILSSRCV
jgi:hypothetical protein